MSCPEPEPACRPACQQIFSQARRPRGSLKPAGDSKVKFAGRFSLKPAGCGSFQPAARSEVKPTGRGSLQPQSSLQCRLQSQSSLQCRLQPQSSLQCWLQPLSTLQCQILESTFQCLLHVSATQFPNPAQGVLLSSCLPRKGP